MRVQHRAAYHEKWTEQELALLEPYLTERRNRSLDQLARALGREPGNVQRKISAIRAARGIRTDKSTVAPFTQKEIDTIFAIHRRGHSDWARIASLLPGRSIPQLQEAYTKEWNRQHSTEDETPTAEPATIPCMRCREIFDSWDKKKNRLCQKCVKENSEEVVYTTASSRHPWTGA